VTGGGNFAGTVALSVSGLPSGVSGSFNPSSISGSGTSTLNLTVANTVPNGSYPLTVTGTSGSLTQTTTVTLAVSGATAAVNGYSYGRVITIDHTKVPNADQVNFPVLISGTYSYLATVANGGRVQNANGYDIVFTSDAAGTNKLDHELESYNAATARAGQFEL
jgi:hypothetical protein